MKKSGDSTTSTRTQTQTSRATPQQKFGTFEPSVWEPFQAYCDARGMKTTSFLERVVRDAVSGRYVHLHLLKPETLDELERSADESGTTTDALVSRIVSEWCVAKMNARKKK